MSPLSSRTALLLSIASIFGAGLVGTGCFTNASEDESLGTSTSALYHDDDDDDDDDGHGDRAAISRGRRNFFDQKLRGLDGNGRSCEDCHMKKDSFQLSPAHVEARWQKLQKKRAKNPNADDPLFRAIDADDFRINGENASDFSNLRDNALVRITFTLPPNIKLIDPITNQPSAATEVDVWRSVPSINNVKLTGADGQAPNWFRPPNPQGGYQLDARAATLQDQAIGALFSHGQIQTPPSQGFLDDIAAFENSRFSSRAVRKMSRAIDRGEPAPDPDGRLTPIEQEGKAHFERSCSGCHGGPGQSTPLASLGVRYTDIISGCARPVDGAPPPIGPRWNFKQCPPRLAKNMRWYEISFPDGSKQRRPSSDPGRALLTGFVLPPSPIPVDDWQKFDTPTLRGIRKTAPYFHNNSADNLEEVVDHYEAFFNIINAVNPGSPLLRTPSGESRVILPGQKPALVAYLNKL